MNSYVNLVLIMLTLVYIVNGLHSSSLNASAVHESVDSWSSASSTRDEFARKLKRPVSAKIHRPAAVAGISTRHDISVTNKKHVENVPKFPKSGTSLTAKTNKLALIHDLSLNSKTDLELRESKRKNKKRRNQVIMAMLLAYKFKFAALIPVLIGGLALLTATTALAGFFFALFAAVLGLKGK